VSETFQMGYEARVDAAISNIDRLIAKIAQLEAATDRSKAKLRTLGSDTSGVRTAMGSISNLGRAFSALDALADRSHGAVRRVGQDTGGMTRAAAKAKELEDRLHTVEVRATTAAAAVSGVGQGMGGGGRGGAGAGMGGGGGGGPGAGFIGQVGRRVATDLVSRGIHATAGAYGDAQEEERDFQNSAAGRAIAFREERRELSGLMGHTDPNAAVLGASTKLMRSTGMDSREEAAFSTEYYGSAAVGRDKGNLGKAGADRDALEARNREVGGKFGVRVGLDLKTAGDLTGIIGAYKKVGSERDVAGQLAGLHYGLDQGRGQMTPLTKGALAQAGKAVSDEGQIGDVVRSGRVADLPELGAMIGVMSAAAKGAGSSGTNYGQLSRMLNKSGGQEGDFLQQAGVAGAKGDLAKLNALKGHLDKNKVGDIDKYLQDQGFGNQTDRAAAVHAIQNAGVMNDRVKEAHKRAANPDDFLRKNDEFKMGVLGQKRLAQADAEATEVERGTGAEALITLRQQGATHRMGKDYFTHQKGSASGSFSARVLGWAGAGDGEQELDDMEGIRLLKERYKASGKDLGKEFPELTNQVGGAKLPWDSKGRTSETNQVRERDVARAIASIEATEKAAREQKEAAARLNDAAGALQAAAAAMPGGGGATPAPAGGKPAAVPKRI
jgi:hypothetical protein